MENPNEFIFNTVLAVQQAFVSEKESYQDAVEHYKRSLQILDQLIEKFPEDPETTAVLDGSRKFFGMTREEITLRMQVLTVKALAETTYAGFIRYLLKLLSPDMFNSQVLDSLCGMNEINTALRLINETGSDRERAHYIARLVMELEQSGGKENTAVVFEGYSGNAPLLSHVAALIARSLTERNDYSGALEWAQKVGDSLFMDTMEGVLVLGVSLGKTQDVLQRCKTLADKKNYEILAEAVACALLEAGDIQSARFLTDGLKDIWVKMEVYKRMAHLLIGKGDIKGAYGIFPVNNHADLLADCAVKYTVLKKKKQAAVYFNRAVKLIKSMVQPDVRDELYGMLARAYLKSGQTKKAVSLLSGTIKDGIIRDKAVASLAGISDLNKCNQLVNVLKKKGVHDSIALINLSKRFIALKQYKQITALPKLTKNSGIRDDLYRALCFSYINLSNYQKVLIYLSRIKNAEKRIEVSESLLEDAVRKKKLYRLKSLIIKLSVPEKKARYFLALWKEQGCPEDSKPCMDTIESLFRFIDSVKDRNLRISLLFNMSFALSKAYGTVPKSVQRIFYKTIQSEE
ncbi:MAG: hypothetical protein JW969_15260 [Spirochaetales bacterium]|nr:hypothetical protein [Spirochaetales bacterium]